MRCIIILSILFLLPAAGFSADIHVPMDYPTIQQAIDAATNGDSVIVAPGTYVENINLKGKAVVVRSEMGPDSTTIDGNRSGSVVWAQTNETPATVLDGFTITNGYQPTGNGGGIYLALGSSPTIMNCVLADNEAIALGGGIACHGQCSPIITKCTFLRNIARGHYEGAGGGGICCFILSNPTITDCVFIENESEYGGAIECGVSFPTITNCAFIGNIADKGGGAISFGASDPVVTNCTMTQNIAGFGGAVALTGLVLPSYPILTNCIMYNDIPNEVQVLIGQPTITYSNVQGGWPGTANIDADPLFVNPFAGDFHLTHPSPCRDTGRNSAVPSGILDDFEGDPRISQGTVDMGADEFHTHLYHTGNVVPGGYVEIKFIGLPGTAPVGLFVGSGLLDPPLPSMWGDWYLAFPILGPFDLDAIPSPSGVLILSGILPTVPPAPYDLPMQALIGNELTNPSVVRVY